MKEKLEGVLSTSIPTLPKQVNLKLPKLKKMESPNLKLPNLKSKSFPNLKKVNA